MPDKILIRQLCIPTKIGVTEAERDYRQDIFLDLEYSSNFDTAAVSDQIADTIDYGVICRELTAFVKDTEHQLIEALASSIADYLFRVYPMTWFRLTLTKSPFDIPEVSKISITIERSRL